MKIDGYKFLYVIGDMQGDFRKLVYDITYREKLRDSVIIITGDCKFGYHKEKYYSFIYGKIKKRLESMNNILLCIRGNNDDPSYFNNNLINFPRLKLIQDYTILEAIDRTILCIGGATSKNRSDKWWIDERPIKVSSNHLPWKVDCIISHEAPIQFSPIFIRDDDTDTETYLNICDDRNQLGNILLELHPNNWIYSHYKESTSGDWGNTIYRGLDVNEIFKIK